MASLSISLGLAYHLFCEPPLAGTVRYQGLVGLKIESVHQPDAGSRSSGDENLGAESPTLPTLHWVEGEGVGAELDRVKDRKRSRALIEDLYLDANRVYVIHYSCESFYENDTGESKRVTSIATRNLKTGQTKSWSIHKEAELSKQLSSMQTELNKFEKSMLKGFSSGLISTRIVDFYIGTCGTKISGSLHSSIDFGCSAVSL